MRKHTMIDLDMDLVDEAAVILGTKSIIATVHAALRDVTDSRKRLRLPDLDLDLSPERLEADRAGRIFRYRAAQLNGDR